MPADLGSFDSDRTFIAPSPVLRESAPHRVRAQRRRWPLYVVLALIGAAAIVVGVLALGGSKGNQQGRAGGGPRAIPCHSQASARYDPHGTGGEHDGDAPKATDGNPATFWYTEHYDSPRFGGLKDGVGLVLDAGSATTVSQLDRYERHAGLHRADRVRAARRPGRSHRSSGRRRSMASTTFALTGATARYYVVWITNLGAHASVDVNEVKARCLELKLRAALGRSSASPISRSSSSA